MEVNCLLPVKSPTSFHSLRECMEEEYTKDSYRHSRNLIFSFCTGADPGFSDGGFVPRARKAR